MLVNTFIAIKLYAVRFVYYVMVSVVLDYNPTYLLHSQIYITCQYDLHGSNRLIQGIIKTVEEQRQMPTPCGYVPRNLSPHDIDPLNYTLWVLCFNNYERMSR